MDPDGEPGIRACTSSRLLAEDGVSHLQVVPDGSSDSRRPDARGGKGLPNSDPTRTAQAEGPRERAIGPSMALPKQLTGFVPGPAWR